MTAANGNGNGARAADDWIVTGEEGSANGREHTGGVKEEYEGEPEFSDILADAILKRPDSIRVRTPTLGTKSQQQRDAVLKFPSLSGNVESATPDEARRADRNGSSSEVNGAGDMSDGASITDGILNGSGVAETHKTLDPQLVTETGPSNTE
jgi:hypothetical protein